MNLFYRFISIFLSVSLAFSVVAPLSETRPSHLAAKSSLQPSTPSSPSLLQSLDQKIPRSYFLNYAVIIGVGVILYFLGFMPKDVTLSWALFQTTLTKTVFTFGLYAVLAEILARRSAEKPITLKVILMTVTGGILNGVLTNLFFTAFVLQFPIYGVAVPVILLIAAGGVLFRYFVLKKSFKHTLVTSALLAILFLIAPGFLRTALVAFDLVYVRNKVTKYFQEGEDVSAEERVRQKNRYDEGYWLARPYSLFVKNLIIQNLVPLAARGTVEAIANYMFQLFYVKALHDTGRDSIVGREDVVRKIQTLPLLRRLTEERNYALFVYGLICLPWVIWKSPAFLRRVGGELLKRLRRKIPTPETTATQTSVTAPTVVVLHRSGSTLTALHIFSAPIVDQSL